MTSGDPYKLGHSAKWRKFGKLSATVTNEL